GTGTAHEWRLSLPARPVVSPARACDAAHLTASGSHQRTGARNRAPQGKAMKLDELRQKLSEGDLYKPEPEPASAKRSTSDVGLLGAFDTEVLPCVACTGKGKVETTTVS